MITGTKQLLVFDPGGTTGWAVFDYGDNELWRVSRWGIIPFDTLHIDLRVIVDSAIYVEKSTAVVYENITANSSKFNPVGLEVIGMIKLICLESGVPFSSQQPGCMEAARKWNLVDLKAFKSVHTKDAVLHGIAHIGAEHFYNSRLT